MLLLFLLFVSVIVADVVDVVLFCTLYLMMQVARTATATNTPRAMMAIGIESLEKGRKQKSNIEM